MGVGGRQPQSLGPKPIITARKRSLGQGNIFIGMCQEFCSQEGGVWSRGVSGPGGCLLHGGSAPGGLLPGLSAPGMSALGVSAPGGVCSQGGVCSGGCVCSWGGVSAPGDVCSGGCLVEIPPMDTAAAGTHPTGMHSCLIRFLPKPA